MPSTIVVSLFYYFGLVYTHALYEQLGLAGAGLDFSTNDYVFRSTNVIIEPLRWIVVMVLVALFIHVSVQFVLGRINMNPSLQRRIRIVLAILFIVGGLTLMWVFLSPTRFGYRSFIGGAWWLGGLLSVLYGIHLGWFRRHDDEDPTAVQAAFKRGSPAAVIATIVAIVLIAHGSFEIARFYARERALQVSIANEAACFSFAEVRIYSTVDLHLEGLGVTHADLGGADGSYRHRYDGLRLFNHDNGRYILWPIAQSPRDGAFVLRETDSLRVEFVPLMLTSVQSQELEGTCPRTISG